MLRWLIGRPDEDEVRLPKLGSDHQSAVPGLFVVGDLAGAPTILIAANQGHEVMKHIASLPDGRAESKSDVHDVVIVGGGSSGIAAALEAKRFDLHTVVLDGGRLANTIREFPKAKEIYAEPKAVPNESRLWIEDSVKEELLERWDSQLAAENLNVREGETVTDIRREHGRFTVTTASGGTYLGRRVLLAIGKRGNPRKLGVPGEDLEKVFYKLYDPAEHRGENVLVVGGGDSAVEAAVALSEIATTTLSYRRDGFFRLKGKNREKIERAVEIGRVEVLFESSVREIREKEVVLEVEGEERVLANDCLLVSIGAELPHRFFRRVGIRMEKQWSPARVAVAALVIAVFWMVYAAKKYPPLFPWDVFGVSWGDLDFGLHWWVWFTILYSLAVLVFGIRAMRKYWYSKFQRWKYASVIFSQCFLLCIFPIWIAPAIWPDSSWNAFHLILAWPLSIEAIPKPWGAGNLGPFLYAVGLTFVAIPVFVYFLGSRFCSWICGCGALAETLGDEVRHLAPRGPKSIRFERIAGRTVLILATVVTLWFMFMVGWGSAVEGARAGRPGLLLYGVWVDVLLAGALGVGLYWFMGNRIWCRFFCPLRMFMNLVGSIASRFEIVPSRDKCIACGQCSRECQMGIPVMDFAKRGEAVTLRNSSCIGCGICVDVCPVDVLHWDEDRARAAEPKKLRNAEAPAAD